MIFLTDGLRKYLLCPQAPVPLKSYTVVNSMSEYSLPITVDIQKERNSGEREGRVKICARDRAVLNQTKAVLNAN